MVENRPGRSSQSLTWPQGLLAGARTPSFVLFTCLKSNEETETQINCRERVRVTPVVSCRPKWPISLGDVTLILWLCPCSEPLGAHGNPTCPWVFSPVNTKLFHLHLSPSRGFWEGQGWRGSRTLAWKKSPKQCYPGGAPSTLSYTTWATGIFSSR